MVKNMTQSSEPRVLVETRTYALRDTITRAVTQVVKYDAIIAGPLSWRLPGGGVLESMTSSKQKMRAFLEILKVLGDNEY